MAERFNLTAQIQLQAPTNTAQVVGQIRKQLKGINIDVKVKANTPQVAKLNKELQGVSKASDASAKSIGRMNTTLAQAARRFSVITVATGSLLALARAFKNGTSQAVAFERELIKISQVSGKSVARLQSLSKEVTRLSTGLGAASSDLLNVSRVLTQAGFSATKTKQALETLAKTTLAATFDSIQDTTEGAIAVLRQFSDEARRAGGDVKFLASTMDAINSVSKSFAVESGDLITVIRRVGGVFAATGGKVNELIALFTSVRATTRESAETIATGLRTIFTRLQRTDTVDQLKELGIQLRNSQGQFVGAYEAVRRLSAGLSQLDPRDAKFSDIVEELGGFRQVGKVIPLIQQFATAQAALSVAQNSSGSVARDAAKAQAGLGVQITKVKEEFSALLRQFADSGSFRSLATGALQIASAFIKVASALETVLPLLTLLMGMKLGQLAAPGLGALIGGARGKNQGGKIHGFARGGHVPGTGSRDTVPAMLSPGEFVIKKSSAKKLGASTLQAMNNNRYASGGAVQLSRHSAAMQNLLYTGQRNISKQSGVDFDPSKNQFTEGDTFTGNIKKTKIRPQKSVVDRMLKADKAALLNSSNTIAQGNAFEKYLIASKRMSVPTGFGATHPLDGKKGSELLEVKRTSAADSILLDKNVRHQIKTGNKLKGTRLSGGEDNISLPDLTELELDKNALTALVDKKAKGGGISGSDTVPALLTPGEFVINKSSAQGIGYSNLNKMNQTGVKRFAAGGRVGGVQRFANGGGVSDPLLDLFNKGDSSSYSFEELKAAANQVEQNMLEMGYSAGEAVIAFNEFVYAMVGGVNATDAYTIANNKALEANKKRAAAETEAAAVTAESTDETEKVSESSKKLNKAQLAAAKRTHEIQKQIRGGGKEAVRRGGGGGGDLPGGKASRNLGKTINELAGAAQQFAFLGSMAASVGAQFTDLEETTQSAISATATQYATIIGIGGTLVQMFTQMAIAARSSTLASLLQSAASKASATADSAEAIASATSTGADAAETAASIGSTGADTVEAGASLAAAAADGAESAASAAVVVALLPLAALAAIIAVVAVRLSFLKNEAIATAAKLSASTDKMIEAMQSTGKGSAEAIARSQKQTVEQQEFGNVSFTAGLLDAITPEFLEGFIGDVTGFKIHGFEEAAARAAKYGDAIDASAASMSEAIKEAHAMNEAFADIDSRRYADNAEGRAKRVADTQGVLNTGLGASTSRSAQADKQLRAISAQTGVSRTDLTSRAGDYEGLDAGQKAVVDNLIKKLDAAGASIVELNKRAQSNLSAVINDLDGTKTFDELMADSASPLAQTFKSSQEAIKAQADEQRRSLEAQKENVRAMQAGTEKREAMKKLFEEETAIRQRETKALKANEEGTRAQVGVKNALVIAEKEATAAAVAFAKSLREGARFGASLSYIEEELERAGNRINNAMSALGEGDINLKRDKVTGLDDPTNLAKRSQTRREMLDIKDLLPDDLKPEFSKAAQKILRGDRFFGQQDKFIEEASQGSIKTGGADQNKFIEKLLREANVDPNNAELRKTLTDKIKEAIAAGKFGTELASIFSFVKDNAEQGAKLVEQANQILQKDLENYGSYIDGIQSLRDKEIEARNKLIDVQTKGAEIRAEARGNQVSIEARERARQAKAAESLKGTGAQAGDVAGLGRVLAEATSKQAQLANSAATRENIAESKKQANIIKKVNAELERLGDQSERAGDILGEIDKERQKRQAVTEVVEDFVVGGRKERQDINRSIDGINKALRTGTLQNQSPDQRSATVAMLDRLGDIQLAGSGGRTGKQVKQELIFRDAIRMGLDPEIARQLATATSKEEKLIQSIDKLSDVMLFAAGVQANQTTMNLQNAPGPPASLNSNGGLIYRADGGSVFQPKGTDTVPAMLTPGEFVIKKSSVDRIGAGNLQALNNGVQYRQGGGKVMYLAVGSRKKIPSLADFRGETEFEEGVEDATSTKNGKMESWTGPFFTGSGQGPLAGMPTQADMKQELAKRAAAEAPKPPVPIATQLSTDQLAAAERARTNPLGASDADTQALIAKMHFDRTLGSSGTGETPAMMAERSREQAAQMGAAGVGANEIAKMGGNVSYTGFTERENNLNKFGANVGMKARLGGALKRGIGHIAGAFRRSTADPGAGIEHVPGMLQEGLGGPPVTRDLVIGDPNLDISPQGQLKRLQKDYDESNFIEKWAGTISKPDPNAPQFQPYDAAKKTNEAVDRYNEYQAKVEAWKVQNPNWNKPKFDDDGQRIMTDRKTPYPSYQKLFPGYDVKMDKMSWGQAKREEQRPAREAAEAANKKNIETVKKRNQDEYEAAKAARQKAANEFGGDPTLTREQWKADKEKARKAKFDAFGNRIGGDKETAAQRAARIEKGAKQASESGTRRKPDGTMETTAEWRKRMGITGYDEKVAGIQKSYDQMEELRQHRKDSKQWYEAQAAAREKRKTMGLAEQRADAAKWASKKRPKRFTGLVDSAGYGPKNNPQFDEETAYLRFDEGETGYEGMRALEDQRAKERQSLHSTPFWAEKDRIKAEAAEKGHTATKNRQQEKRKAALAARAAEAAAKRAVAEDSDAPSSTEDTTSTDGGRRRRRRGGGEQEQRDQSTPLPTGADYKQLIDKLRQAHRTAKSQGDNFDRGELQKILRGEYSFEEAKNAIGGPTNAFRNLRTSTRDAWNLAGTIFNEESSFSRAGLMGAGLKRADAADLRRRVNQIGQFHRPRHHALTGIAEFVDGHGYDGNQQDVARNIFMNAAKLLRLKPGVGLRALKDAIKKQGGRNSFYMGLPAQGFATGGGVAGSDTVPAMLTPGEFVMSKNAVQSHGVGYMKQLNKGHIPGFRRGGVVGTGGVQYKQEGGQIGGGGGMAIDPSGLAEVLSNFNVNLVAGLDNVVAQFAGFSQSFTNLAATFSNLTMQHSFSGDMTLAFNITNADAIKNAVADAVTPKITEIITNELNTRLNKDFQAGP